MSSGRKRGIKSRLLDAEPATSSDGARSSYQSRSIRRRVEASDLAAQGVAQSQDLPLNTSLRKSWASGELPANKVLEFSGNAGKQGAHGVLWNKDLLFTCYRI